MWIAWDEREEGRLKRADRRGVALLVVLALLVALGAIAAGLGHAVRTEGNTVATLRARTVARYAAESGIVVAEWRLQTALDSAASAVEWGAAFKEADAWLGQLRRVALGDARFEVAAIDLNARVDLNRSSTATVQGLFDQFTSPGRAAEIVAAIKAKRLYRVSELALIPGVNDALAAAVAPYVTVWGDGTVNINSASEPVLAALQGVGDVGARSILTRRASGEIFGSASSIQPVAETMSPAASGDDQDPLGLSVSTAPTRFLVVSRGWRTGHPLTHEVQAVYAVTGTRLTLQIWQERDL